MDHLSSVSEMLYMRQCVSGVATTRGGVVWCLVYLSLLGLHERLSVFGAKGLHEMVRVMDGVLG